jgi:hypothetical protein
VGEALFPTTGAMADAALRRAASLGLPTTASEDWRYVDVKPLQTAIAASANNTAVTTGQAGVTVVDGRFITAGPFTAPDDVLRAAETKRLDAEAEAPACWSWTGETRALRVTGRRTLLLDHHASGGLSGWRLLIDLAPAAELDLVITHRVARGARTSVGIVVALAQGSRLRLAEVAPRPCGQLFLQADVRVERDATATWTAASRGGELLRWRGVVDLAATGAHADIAAVDQVSDHDQAHRHVRVRHRVGPTTSTQVFKTVLNDHAIASFDGLVDVAKGADGANAEQLSRTLLLSPTARGDTRPQLDIHADEVKAGHGATIGQLDADELLYLRMRGLAPAQAKTLLIDGFVREVTDRLPESARFAETSRP